MEGRLIVVAAAAIGLILLVSLLVARLLLTRTRGISIRMQVFLALATIVGAFAFGLGLLVVDRVESRAVRLARQAAEDEASAMASIVKGELISGDLKLGEVAVRLERERREGIDLRFMLLGADGRVLFPLGGPDPMSEPGRVHVDKPIILKGRRLGAVRVFKETIVVRRMLWDFLPSVLVTGLVLLAAAAFAAARIGRAIARPIEDLSLFAERVSAGERAVSSPSVYGREVRRLGRSIDSMKRQLEGRPFVETFAADLSHELKNPVAAIRASAEVLEEGALDEPDEARRFVSRIHESSLRIERLLGELLSLARIEARGIEGFDTVDLGELARATATSADAPPVEVDVRGDVRVRGDRRWLARALQNLIDNARIHAPGGTGIRVSLRGTEDHVTLEVHNDGSVQRAVRRRLFRRFVTTRPDKGGTGLGLAIVRAVAEAHRGRIELAEAGPPHVVFRLSLPPVGAAPESLRSEG